MRNDILRKLEYRMGRPQLIKYLTDSLCDNSQEKVIQSLQKQFPDLDFSTVQLGSWVRKYGIRTGEPKVGKHVVDRLLDILDTPLQDLLEDLYYNKNLSSRDIADHISTRYLNNEPVDYNRVLEWMGTCNIAVRSPSEQCKLRWLKDSERTSASLKGLNFFDTKAGHLRKKEISRWYSDVWLKKHNKHTSSLEVQVSEILNQSDIIYTKNKTINIPSYDNGIIPDFILEDKKLIEVMGDYWHRNPNSYPRTPILSDMTVDKTVLNLNRDIHKFKELKNNGYKILFIWEYDLIHRLDDVLCMIDMFCNNLLDTSHSFNFKSETYTKFLY